MIRVNNRDEIAWEERLTISVLLERFHYTFPHIIVKIDGVVIPPVDYPTAVVPNGAEVQVIHLIAGG